MAGGLARVIASERPAAAGKRQSPPFRTESPMSHASLLALSPLDGRYAGKVDALRPVFSEYGLIKARVCVEVEWLIALAEEPGIFELPAFSEAAKQRLRTLAASFSPEQAEEVKKKLEAAGAKVEIK